MSEHEIIQAVGRAFERYPVMYVKQGWTFKGVARNVYEDLAEVDQAAADAFLKAAGLELGSRGGIQYAHNVEPAAAKP